MFEPGTYQGTVAEAVTSEKNGKDQVVLTFDVTAMAENGEWRAVPQEQRRIYLFLTDAAWPYTQDRLAAMGFNGDFDTPQFSKPTQNLVCRHETYNGELREKWDLAGGGGGIEKAAPDRIMRLNAKWQSKANSPATTGAPVAPPAPGGAPAPAPAAQSTLAKNVSTRDQAWEFMLRDAGGDAAKAGTYWSQATEAVTKATGKPEAGFGPAEWQQVAEHVDIPF